MSYQHFAPRPAWRIGVLLALAALSGAVQAAAPAKAPPAKSVASPTADNGVGLMPAPDAVRFLNQAGLGATDAQLADIQPRWRLNWLEYQMSLPVTTTHWDRVKRIQQALIDSGVDQQKLPVLVWDNAIWESYLSDPDVYRKRAAYTLSQILVVSMEGLSGGGQNTPLLAAGYLDMLERNAWGNFRQLLEDMALSPAMGNYLSADGNCKAEYDSDGTPIRVPDENFAREIMQLFTIGLHELDQYGTVVIDPKTNRPKETYAQKDVAGLAKVFTGWRRVRGQPRGEQLRTPMEVNADCHSLEKKEFLTASIPKDTNAKDSLKIALDTLFNHPNVGPFIGKQLIQRMVTSNPSKEYVARVAAKFADNGSGVRGDMKAVFDQVLRDPEAMSQTNIYSPAPTWGKLREPVLRFTQFGRLFGMKSSTPTWSIGNLSDPAYELGQSPLRSPSVFNFYRPGYVPPHTAIAEKGLVAPEFQITTNTSIPGYVNTLQRFMANPPAGISYDYTREMALAGDPVALVARLNLMLANNALSNGTKDKIVSAVSSLPAGTDAERLTRVRTAILMTLAAPDFIAQK